MTDRLDALASECERLHIRLAALHGLGEPSLMGRYDRKTRAISIAPGLSHAQQVVTLEHELTHARHDIAHIWDPDPRVEEARTRRQTALALVNPVDYMIAERCYGPDAWQIAVQLGVTVSLIQDWQQIVHDDPQLVKIN